MHPFERAAAAEDRRACERARAALRSQIELLEDEWGSGMERDTLVLIDHACARLAEVEAMLARPREAPLAA
jgi:hypothetical protein